MAVRPHSIDITVADMARSLRFYRAIGLAAPTDQDDAVHVQIVTPGGATIGLFAEAVIRGSMPGWITPVGQRVTFACICDDIAEVDAVYARVVADGHAGLRAPWHTPWGQYYAFLQDPDGNRVDLFTPTSPEGAEG